MNVPNVPNPDQQPTTYTSTTGSQNFYNPNQPMGYETSGYPAQSYRHQPPHAEEDPGKVLGIISLVATLSTFIGFNFLGPIIGIITGYMARNNSRRAGYADNDMGKWGFILGIIFISLAALGGLLGLSIGAFAGLAGLLGA